MIRPSKDELYLRIAKDVARFSACTRRQYGAVIVKDDTIVSTGYNGMAKGEESCCDAFEKCRAIHAEMNAINHARTDLKGATLYLAGYEKGKALHNIRPCEICSRIIQNEGITRVVTGWDDDTTRRSPIEGPGEAA